MKPDTMNQQALDLLEKKDWPALAALVEQGRWDPNHPIIMDDGRKIRYSLLACLIYGGATEAALAVIQKGAALDVWQEGWTPLMIACQYQNHAVIEALINAGAKVNLRSPRGEDGGGETALILAAEKIDTWAVRRLLEAGADVSCATRAGETALAVAARTAGAKLPARAEHVELVRLLAAAGCPLLGNELHQPVWNRDFPMVQCLIDCGCDLNGRCRKSVSFQQIVKGDTPFIMAIRQTSRELLEIDGPATPPEESFERLLRDRRRIAELLLEKGADPNLTNAHSLSALAYVVIQRDREYVRWLVSIGAELHSKPVDRPRLQDLMGRVLEGKATLGGDPLF